MFARINTRYRTSTLQQLIAQELECCVVTYNDQAEIACLPSNKHGGYPKINSLPFILLEIGTVLFQFVPHKIETDFMNCSFQLSDEYLVE
ncbi:hypothetical protein CDAR_262571 [Caerostris darwini]|uniref:Uncharacterized protein n=1 Tax=Caerostris darwini TaxID=1538125 RepID=A0AAV4TBJ9_9ARAC|nr:hypothetical protein CDAR_262571 [Caerostris darwini]